MGHLSAVGATPDEAVELVLRAQGLALAYLFAWKKSAADSMESAALFLASVRWKTTRCLRSSFPGRP